MRDKILLLKWINHERSIFYEKVKLGIKSAYNKLYLRDPMIRFKPSWKYCIMDELRDEVYYHLWVMEVF